MSKSYRKVNGIVVVDKPAGITSYDVVRLFKRVMPRVKIGYLGTLDPLATGVLPLLLGEGTKLVPFLEIGKKVYEAALHLGVVTDTQDREGRVLRSTDIADYDLSSQHIETVLQHFRGRIMQQPPMYSALKHNGEPLYKLARRGEETERSLREVEIYELHVTEIDPPVLRLHIECSKGTYIRTVAHDIGEELGCGAHLAELRRVRSGPFGLEDALSMDDIEDVAHKGKIKERMIPLSRAVDFLPAVELGEADTLQVRNGQAITLEGIHHRVEENGTMVKVVTKKGGGLVAVGGIERIQGGLVLRPLRVFHEVVFTKNPPYGRDTVHKRINQGGR
jgi:tRNA pseudouridine55 synthase